MRVIIVGAGAIGSSTAYFLSQKPDVEVIVIEQTHVAAAASGKAGGFLARDWCSGPLDALARRSFDLHAELADKHNNPWQYRRLDTVSVKQSGRSQARVEDIAWLDGVEKGQAGVMGTPATTAQVTPELYTKGMMQLAIDNGARLTTASVVGLNRSATGDVDGVELADGSVVKADKVVLCMGPWTGKAREWIPSLPDVAGSKAYSIVVQPKEPDAITPHAIFVSYTTRDKMKHPEIYPRPDGTVYMCGAMDDTPLPSTADQVAGSEEAARRLHAIMGIHYDQLFELRRNVEQSSHVVVQVNVRARSANLLLSRHKAATYPLVQTATRCSDPFQR
eukprot:TRINITY_DN10743_c0_g1_i2.p1 TRINITY_DN10743_c0_g1~~TRINITY_DN10743_c0_g1_i2.p1  ORF type:complete len:334 (+),score=53.86 TRINITY_DN10743_c0_g1_i2:111-1112(+)